MSTRVLIIVWNKKKPLQCSRRDRKFAEINVNVLVAWNSCSNNKTSARIDSSNVNIMVDKNDVVWWGGLKWLHWFHQCIHMWKISIGMRIRIDFTMCKQERGYDNAHQLDTFAQVFTHYILSDIKTGGLWIKFRWFCGQWGRPVGRPHCFNYKNKTMGEGSFILACKVYWRPKAACYLDAKYISLKVPMVVNSCRA